MALFGAPLAHEDHAVRACHAALRMQQTVGWYAEELRRGRGVDVQIRVGLNSGEVVVRAIDSDLHMDYSAIGQTTHLAARMEQLARPGSILISRETLRLAEGTWRSGARAGAGEGHARAGRGLRAGPLRAGPLAPRGQRRARLTPFVGRETGWTRSTRRWRGPPRATAGGGGVGRAGVGKSRLFWEFTHSHRAQLAHDGGAGHLLRQEHLLPHGRSCSELLPPEERDDVRARPRESHRKLLTLDESLRPTLPAFLQLLDVPVDDAEWQTPDLPQRRQRMLDAVKRLILREGQVQPVLLVFENLHWLDSESQAFLDSLVDSLPLARALVLVSYRPEYQHGWARKSYYTQFRIDPLPPQSSEELLRALMGDDPGLGPLKQLLIERTEGNPLFIEESVRTLAETKVLAGTPGHYRVTREVQKVQVPATVQAVLAARIDRLPIEGKRLLQAAAVIGKDVSMALLQEIADLSEETVRRNLTLVQSGEFLYEISLFPSVEYTFRHALTHEVAYSSLLQDRRAPCTAAWSRGSSSSTRTACPSTSSASPTTRCAARCGRGGGLSPPGGDQATARSANREAVTFIEQAMAALGRLPEGRPATELAIDLRLDLRRRCCSSASSSAC
jgi:hypothetical protein